MVEVKEMRYKERLRSDYLFTGIGRARIRLLKRLK